MYRANPGLGMSAETVTLSLHVATENSITQNTWFSSMLYTSSFHEDPKCLSHAGIIIVFWETSLK